MNIPKEQYMTKQKERRWNLDAFHGYWISDLFDFLSTEHILCKFCCKEIGYSLKYISVHFDKLEHILKVLYKITSQ